jgi:hypothetical protein
MNDNGSIIVLMKEFSHRLHLDPEHVQRPQKNDHDGESGGMCLYSHSHLLRGWQHTTMTKRANVRTALSLPLHVQMNDEEWLQKPGRDIAGDSQARCLLAMQSPLARIAQYRKSGSGQHV